MTTTISPSAQRRHYVAELFQDALGNIRYTGVVTPEITTMRSAIVAKHCAVFCREHGGHCFVVPTRPDTLFWSKLWRKVGVRTAAIKLDIFRVSGEGTCTDAEYDMLAAQLHEFNKMTARIREELDLVVGAS